jgi:hypothetical protein
MGPSESATTPARKQAARRQRFGRRPRVRRCLLKGCEQSFQPRQARQRYCSEDCRKGARKWSRWKAQQRYRDTAVGKEKRNGQSRRYRERVQNRKASEKEAVEEVARVITPEEFFRAFLRPARLLREIRRAAAKPFTTLLLARLPARSGASPGTGAALERSARLNPDILILSWLSRTFSLSDASGISPTRTAVGTPASPGPATAATAAGVTRRIRPANADRGGGCRRQQQTLCSDRWL